jgi:hypothetical protein
LTQVINIIDGERVEIGERLWRRMSAPLTGYVDLTTIVIPLISPTTVVMLISATTVRMAQTKTSKMMTVREATVMRETTRIKTKAIFQGSNRGRTVKSLSITTSQSISTTDEHSYSPFFDASYQPAAVTFLATHLPASKVPTVAPYQVGSLGCVLHGPPCEFLRQR